MQRVATCCLSFFLIALSRGTDDALPNIAICCRVLQRVAACCSVLQRVAAYCSMSRLFSSSSRESLTKCCSVLRYAAAWCSVLQRVAACCSVLRRVAVSVGFLIAPSQVADDVFSRQFTLSLAHSLSLCLIHSLANPLSRYFTLSRIHHFCLSRYLALSRSFTLSLIHKVRQSF